MKLKLVKLGAAWCPPCKAMARAQTLEKFADKHPDVKIEVHDDTESGSTRWEAIANKYDVKSVPTIIWLYDDQEVLRSNDVSATAIKEQYEKAKKRAGLE